MPEADNGNVFHLNVRRMPNDVQIENVVLDGFGGGGGGGGMSGDGSTSIVQRVSQLEGDLRKFFFSALGLIGAAAIIIGGMYVYLSVQTSAVQVAQATANEKLSRLEKIEQKIDDVDGKVNVIDRKLDRISDKLGAGRGK